MSREKSTSELVSGFTSRSVLITLVLIVFIGLLQTHWYNYTNIAVHYNPWPEEGTCGSLHEPIGMIFLVILFLSIIYKKVNLTLQELAVIFSGIALASMPFGPMGAMVTMQYVFGTLRPDYIKNIQFFLPHPWFPPAETYIPFYESGPVPWDKIGGAFSIWVLTFLIWSLLQFFLSLGFIRQVVHAEMLPFPYATPAVHLFKITEEKKNILNFKDLTLKRVWIGFLIGFIFYVHFVPVLFWKDFPALWGPYLAYGRRKIFGWLHFYPATKTALPWFPNNWEIYPELVAATLFIPLDMLATASIWWLWVVLISPPILVGLGLRKPWPAGGYGGWWSAAWDDWMQHPGKLGLLFQSAIWALAFWELIFNFKPVWQTIKGIWSPPPDESEKEPIPCKMIWGSVIVLIILSAMIYSYLGIPIAYFFLILLPWAFLYWYGGIRLHAEVGPVQYWRGGGEGRDFLIYLGGQLGILQPNTKGAYMAVELSRELTFGYISSVQWGALSMTGYYIAANTKTSPRDIFKMQIISIPFIIVLYFLLEVWSLFSLGFGKGWKAAPYWVHGWSNGDASRATDLASGWAENVPYLAGSFVLFGILVALRRFLPWWPVHPWGIALPGLYLGIKLDSTLFVAFIIKSLIIKLGGSRLFEKSVPVLVGVIAGSTAGRLILELVGAAFGLPRPYLA